MIKKAGEEALGALFGFLGSNTLAAAGADLGALPGRGAGSLRLVYGDGQITFVDEGWPAVLDIQGPFTATTPIGRNTQISLPVSIQSPLQIGMPQTVPAYQSPAVWFIAPITPGVVVGASPTIRFGYTEYHEPTVVDVRIDGFLRSFLFTEVVDPYSSATLHIMQASLAPPFNLKGGANTIVATVVDAYGSTASATLAVQVNGAPRPPKNLRVQGGDGKALVSWTTNLEADVVAYNLVRSTAGGPASPVTAQPLTAPVWLDEGLTSGTLVAYQVQAIDQEGRRSALTSPVSVTVGALQQELPAPQLPVDVVATPGDRQIEITWTPTGTQPIAYRVLAADAAAGGVDASAAPYAPVQGQGLNRSLAFVDDGAANGQTRCYQVTALSYALQESAHTAPVCAAAVDLPPAAPTGLTVYQVSSRVRLAWDPISAADLAGYRVQRSVDGGGFAPVGGLMSGTLFEEPAEPGRLVAYRVQAVDSGGQAGPLSAPVAWAALAAGVPSGAGFAVYLPLVVRQ